MSSSNRAQLMRDGYLVKRDVIPPDQLASLRVTFETLLERQKAVWRRDRAPEDPPGGLWDTAPQPRLGNTETFIDADTAEAVELWVSEPIRGLATELLQDEHAGVSAMQMMCNPTFDYGPAPWHRDIHPIDMGPMQTMQDGLVEDGPSYVQWNVPLYDDSVFWIVPGSHTRANSEAENRSLLENSRVPIPGGVQVELHAGDVLVYVNYLMHWGSRYTREPTRRTLHGGHTMYPYWVDLDFTRHLSAETREWFELWATRTAKLKDETERALRAVLDRDARAYAEALEALRPGAGKASKLQLTIWLCKAAMHIHNLKRPDFASLPPEFRRRAEANHAITLNWGPAFAERFTKPEAATIWRRFGPSKTGSWPLTARTSCPATNRVRFPTTWSACAPALPSKPSLPAGITPRSDPAGAHEGRPYTEPKLWLRMRLATACSRRLRPWPYPARHPRRGGGMADARDLKSRDFGRVGSTPTPGTAEAQRQTLSSAAPRTQGFRADSRFVPGTGSVCLKRIIQGRLG